MAPPLMNHRSSLEYKRRPYIAAMATMSTPQKIRVGRRYKKAQRVLPRVLLSIVLVYVVGLCVYFGKYRVRPRHHTAPELPAVLREGEIEMASARRLLCSAAPLREDDEGAGGESGGARIAASEAPTTTTTTTTQTITPIKRGSFLGQQKVFAPGPTRVAPGQDGGGAHPAARVFLLTGASASTPGTADLLSHFLAHYVARGGVPASHVLVVIHTRGGERGDDAAATRELVALCEAAGVFFEVWEGEALLFSAVAHHWEHHLANVADDNDWVVLADLDEHAQVTNEGMNLPQFLGKVDALGYSLVHGDWIDRVSDGGALIAPPRAEPSWPPPETNPSGSSSPMSDAFPLQCTINACDVKGKMTGESAGDYDNVKGPGPNGGGGGGVGESSLNGLRHYSTLAGVVGGGQRVYAHKALHPILDVRTLQDFGLDDVVTASRLTRDHVNAYPIPMKVNHYQWHERTTTQLTRRAREYAACNLLEQERETTRLLARIYANSEVMSDKVCPEISCYPRRGGARGGKDAAAVSPGRQLRLLRRTAEEEPHPDAVRRRRREWQRPERVRPGTPRRHLQHRVEPRRRRLADDETTRVAPQESRGLVRLRDVPGSHRERLRGGVQLAPVPRQRGPRDPRPRTPRVQDGGAASSAATRRARDVRAARRPRGGARHARALRCVLYTGSHTTASAW